MHNANCCRRNLPTAAIGQLREETTVRINRSVCVRPVYPCCTGAEMVVS